MPQPDYTAQAFAGIQTFFDDWRFPTVVLALLAAFVLLMVGILMMPTGSGAAGAFADAFRVWCFNYDPSTGSLEWGYVWMYVAQPLVLAGGVYLLWRRPLRQFAAAGFRGILPYIGAACAIVAGVAYALFSLSGWEARAAYEPPFPGERIRTELAAPPFGLENQDGATVSLDALDGRVVLVTALYTTCTVTCPMIMAQTRSALAALSPDELDDVTVVAMTLDPLNDTREEMRQLADAYGVQAPQFNLLTGPPDYVEQILDRYQFARWHDPETGQTDHANMFILIDRAGLIAYRFGLGAQQSRWLEAALHQLLAERLEE